MKRETGRCLEHIQEVVIVEVIHWGQRRARAVVLNPWGRISEIQHIRFITVAKSQL